MARLQHYSSVTNVIIDDFHVMIWFDRFVYGRLGIAFRIFRFVAEPLLLCFRFVAEKLHGGDSVLVHCSDGWDRKHLT